jgi:hypothetical protein
LNLPASIDARDYEEKADEEETMKRLLLFVAALLMLVALVYVMRPEAAAPPPVVAAPPAALDCDTNCQTFCEEAADDIVRDCATVGGANCVQRWQPSYCGCMTFMTCGRGCQSAEACPQN